MQGSDWAQRYHRRSPQLVGQGQFQGAKEAPGGEKARAALNFWGSRELGRVQQRPRPHTQGEARSVQRTAPGQLGSSLTS